MKLSSLSYLLVLLVCVPMTLFGGETGAPVREPKPISVTASSGSIKLTLLISESAIRAGEFLWHKMSIQNIGPKSIVLFDDVFKDHWAMVGNWHSSTGVFVEVEKQSGDRLRPYGISHALPDLGKEETVSPPDPQERKRVRRMIKKWRKSGFSNSEINKLLAFYSRSKAHRKSSAFRLEPNESIETKAWYYDNRLRRESGWTPQRQFVNYTELAVFNLTSPGIYRIRAVYAEAGSEFRVETPWIEIAVHP